KLESGVRTTYTMGAANQLLWYQDNTGRTTFTSDANGNRLGQITPTGIRTSYTWEYENRLTQAVFAAGSPNTMTYNGDGNRVNKNDSGGISKFLWDENNILLETDTNDVTQVVYTVEPAFYGNLISQNRLTATTVFLFNDSGTTDRLTDSTGNVTDSYVFRAF